MLRVGPHASDCSTAVNRQTNLGGCRYSQVRLLAPSRRDGIAKAGRV